MKIVDKLPEKKVKAKAIPTSRLCHFILLDDGEEIFSSTLLSDCQEHRTKLNGNRKSMPIDVEWR